MAQFAPVTDAELSEARHDPRFRHKLVAENLEHLLAALKRLRAAASENDPGRDRQIKEGVALAVKLSNILHEIAEAHANQPRRSNRSSSAI